MTKNKNILRIALTGALILLIPLVITIHNGGSESFGWNWKLGDFILIGALLFSTGLAIYLAVTRLTNPTYRILAIIAFILLLLLTWMELAVGIFGTPLAGS